MYSEDNIWIDEPCKYVIGQDEEGQDIEVDAIRKETGIWISNNGVDFDGLVEPSQTYEDSRNAENTERELLTLLTPSQDEVAKAEREIETITLLQEVGLI